MNLWIVTIGSSDVQLNSDKVNRQEGRTEKQRSDKIWQYWYEDNIKAECYDIPFEPKRAFNDSEESYRIAARILGIVYESSSEEVKQEIQNYLTFPLLSNFVKELKKFAPLEAIVILLTDQSEIFKDDNERRKPKSPYWQDTCKLELIINSYLQKEFPGVKILPLILSPQEEPGLDDWDRVLNLVRDELKNIPLQSEADTVYVSHQAGTPAISSAVQFSSLAKFRKNVRFLVSNEYSQEVSSIPNSTYLKAIQIQEAQALLDRHDYAGVKLLVYDYLSSENKILLDAAIEWNFAKFDEFASKLPFAQQVNERSQHWWWTAYEEAYLAVVRFRQENIVEALFHSFRAVEGLIREWAIWKYELQIKNSNLNQPKTLYFHYENINMSTQLNDWFERYSNKKYSSVGLFGEPLFELLKASHSPGKWHNNSDIKTVAKITKEERNSTFHQLRGLNQSDLFKAWDTQTETEEALKSRLLACLNFIAKEDLAKEFTSFEEASLMAKVHDELVEAIKRYELQT